MAGGWKSSWAWSVPFYGSFLIAEAVVNSQEWTLSRSIPELRLVGSPVPLSVQRLTCCPLQSQLSPSPLPSPCSVRMGSSFPVLLGLNAPSQLFLP